MRLDKYLSDLNVGTRSQLRVLVRKGHVTVNDEVVKDPGYALTGEETVAVDGRQLTYKKQVYYMLHKPAGVVTATEDRKQRTVLDLMGEDRRKDLFPVGRLDKDTTGLLLLTNDGAFDHHLMSPKHHVEKTYRAEVAGPLSEALVQQFAQGFHVEAEGSAKAFEAAPAKLEILSFEEGGGSVVRLTISEGKYHQVKRMFAAFGCEVTSLKRVAIGSLKLPPSLPEGAHRALTEEELALFGVESTKPNE